jgi:hypothetical protein
MNICLHVLLFIKYQRWVLQYLINYKNEKENNEKYSLNIIIFVVI